MTKQIKRTVVNEERHEKEGYIAQTILTEIVDTEQKDNEMALEIIDIDRLFSDLVCKECKGIKPSQCTHLSHCKLSKVYEQVYAIVLENYNLKLQLQQKNLDIYGKTQNILNLKTEYTGKLKDIKELADKLIVMTNEYDNCYLKDQCMDCKKECQYRLVDRILKVTERNY